jgi:hypothetical protein
VRWCFEHACFQLFYVLFAEHVDVDSVFGAWISITLPVFCLYGAEAEKVGFELNVGEAQWSWKSSRWDGRDSSRITCGAVAAEEASVLPSTNVACIFVLDPDTGWVVTIICTFIVEDVGHCAPLSQLLIKCSLSISLVIDTYTRIRRLIRNLNSHTRPLNLWLGSYIDTIPDTRPPFVLGPRTRLTHLARLRSMLVGNPYGVEDLLCARMQSRCMVHLNG